MTDDGTMDDGRTDDGGANGRRSPAQHPMRSEHFRGGGGSGGGRRSPYCLLPLTLLGEAPVPQTLGGSQTIRAPDFYGSS